MGAIRRGMGEEGALMGYLLALVILIGFLLLRAAHRKALHALAEIEKIEHSYKASRIAREALK